MPGPALAVPPGMRVDEPVARELEEVAFLLEQQGANPWRVRAYRRAANVVRRLDRPLGELFAAEGAAGLMRLPGIGEGLALALSGRIRDGRLALLERLRGDADPIAQLVRVAGIGPRLAERIHDALGISSLEQLAAAARDGRLEGVRGIGPRRAAMIASGTSTALGRRARTDSRAPGVPVAEVLDVDREYRSCAAAGTLPRIAPRRYNPSGEAWLSVLHTTRGDRDYTALYSNSARAHRMGTTRDWVVVYFHDGPGPEDQRTVITHRSGPLAGRRVVAGHLGECLEHYARGGDDSAARAETPSAVGPIAVGERARVAPQA